jgi:hypothetical protein
LKEAAMRAILFPVFAVLIYTNVTALFGGETNGYSVECLHEQRRFQIHVREIEEHRDRGTNPVTVHPFFYEINLEEIVQNNGKLKTNFVWEGKILRDDAGPPKLFTALQKDANRLFIGIEKAARITVFEIPIEDGGRAALLPQIPELIYRGLIKDLQPKIDSISAGELRLLVNGETGGGNILRRQLVYSFATKAWELKSRKEEQ